MAEIVGQHLPSRPRFGERETNRYACEPFDTRPSPGAWAATNELGARPGAVRRKPPIAPRYKLLTMGEIAEK